MVQESLVEYINSQMKLGVSRETIKATLAGAGWQAGDVEDTLKKVESGAQPMSAASSVAKPAEPATTSRIVTPVSAASPAPQTIKVSDLVSSSASAAPVTPASSMPKSGAPKSPLTGPTPAAPAGGPVQISNVYPATSYTAPAKPHGSRGALITEIVLGVVILAVGAFAGFLYMQNSNLRSQVGSLKTQSASVASQLSALQTEVSASTTALTAQVASLDSETQELQTELSFYVAPSSTTPGTTTTATVEGVVFVGKTSYVITAAYGAKIVVLNSKDPAVVSALSPLMATSSTPATTAQFTGTYAPGSDSMTLTALNGNAVQ